MTSIQLLSSGLIGSSMFSIVISNSVIELPSPLNIGFVAHL